MCGIAGIINFNDSPVCDSSIRKMMQLQKHRGPDDEGVFTEDNIGLGFVRLSILDLTPAGHQPMYSADKRYVVVFNGEIFNYIELREELKIAGYSFNTGTDTEVLLAAYMHWGEECLHHFNGMWAFVIYDRQNKSVFGARDRYGIKPFYYYQTNDFLAFSSEIPPLLSLLPGKPSPDNQSIFDYLVFNRTDQTERTFFNEIKKLQHGQKFNIQHSIFDTEAKRKSREVRFGIQDSKFQIPDSKFQIRASKFHISEWYNLRQRVAATSGFENPTDFRQLFSDAVKLRLRSDVPVGVCLSGGLDSSAIVSTLLNDHDKKDLNTFSAVYNKGQYGDETDFIMEYRNQLKNMYFTSPDADTLQADLQRFIRAHGEPIPSTAPYAQFKVNELAAKNVVVTIDGQGADEELAGYHYFFGFYFKDLLRKGKIFRLASEIFYYLKLHRSAYGLKTFAYFLLPRNLRTRTRVNERGFLIPEFVDRHKNLNSIAGNLYGADTLNDALHDHFEYKLEHLLKWEDRNSMCFSLEARVPFLDYRLVEKILATDSGWMIKNGWTKHILREAMKNSMPEKIRMRRDKMGFGTPEDEWFRSPHWQDTINEILNSERFADRKIINPEKARSLYNRHLSGKINISKDIWKWVHLELWFREFIDS
jgi:asparagine synthase (glutamine-hydrolysing)